MSEAQRRLTDNYPLFEWEPGSTIRDNEEIQTNEGLANLMNHDNEEIIFEEASLDHDLPDEEANLDHDVPDEEIRNHDIVVISEDEPDNVWKMIQSRTSRRKTMKKHNPMTMIVL